MPIVDISARAIKRGVIVEPAWYRINVISVGEKAAQPKEGKRPSTNYPVEAEIMFNGDTGDKAHEGVPLIWNLNSNFDSAIVDLLKVAVPDWTPEAGRVNLSVLEGKQIDVYVETGTWEGRLQNQVNHKYRVPRREVQG